MTGRVVIVTGAGKGLGRAYALELARRGMRVVVNNRHKKPEEPSSADQVVAEIRASGGIAIAAYDCAEDVQSGANLVARALDEFGRLDAVIANAGVPEAKSFRTHDLESFREIFDINFFGTLYLLHAAWPHLLKSDTGRAVVSTSGAGLYANAGMSAYSSSKAALIGLMKALALEGARAGVKVNAIAPYAATPMTADYITDPDLIARLTPERIAPLVAWMVGTTCDVTGQILVSAGGRLRQAVTIEGAVVSIDGNIADAVHGTDPLAAPHLFANANEAFADILSRID